jgi:hypothetical protein
MLKRISAVSAAVAGALLIGSGAQAAPEGQLLCDRPLSSATPANCVLQSPNSAPERIAVVTSSSGQPVISGSGQPAQSVRSSSERVLIVSEPASAGAPVYIVEPSAGSSLRRGEQIVIVTDAAVVQDNWRNDAFPDPSPGSSAVEPRRYSPPRESGMDRPYGRHSQPE